MSQVASVIYVTLFTVEKPQKEIGGAAVQFEAAATPS